MQRAKFEKGHIPWNKGIKIDKEKYPNYGHQKPHSDKTKEEFSKSRKGRIAWNKGKKGAPCSEKTKKKMSQNSGKYWLGKTLSKEHKEKLGISHRGQIAWNKGKKMSKEHIKKCLTRRTPSSLEEKFQKIVDKYNLPYKYVGNGSFFIERCNPDFINTNSEKIAVEVYARYYKLRNHTSIEKWKKERASIFQNYGWKVIYFNEIQVNEDNILNKLSQKTK